MNCRCRAIASSYVGADIQGDVSSMRSPLALPVPSSYTSAFTHPSSVAAKKVFFSAYIDPDALPVPFFSTRALQRQRCEGHVSGRGTGSISATRRQGGCSPLPLPCMKTMREQGADGSLSRQQHSGNLARADAGFAQMHARRSQTDR